jgi:hypothetical protein
MRQKLKYPVISQSELDEFLWQEQSPDIQTSDLHSLVNQTIESVFISEYGSILAFAVISQKNPIYFEVEGNGSSESWFADIFCMPNLYSRVIKVENISLEDKYNLDDNRCRQEVDEVYGYSVITNKGVTIISFRNSGSRYYGGWCKEVSSTKQHLTKIEPDINGVWQAA